MENRRPECLAANRPIARIFIGHHVVSTSTVPASFTALQAPWYAQVQPTSIVDCGDRHQRVRYHTPNHRPTMREPRLCRQTATISARQHSEASGSGCGRPAGVRQIREQWETLGRWRSYCSDSSEPTNVELSLRAGYQQTPLCLHTGSQYTPLGQRMHHLDVARLP